MATPLTDLVRFLDSHLRIGEIPDDPNAVNGLQVEACDSVSSVACAVDATEPVIEEAARRGAQLLLVHHGLLWGGNRPITGPHARKIGRCFASGLSIYSAHLPLDVHPESGNNARLVSALGLRPEGAFGRYQGIEIGLTATCDWSREELEKRCTEAIGPVHLTGRGPDRIRRVAVITGSAGSFAAKAARAGLDALITGEGPYYTALDAEEHGIWMVLGGHYRTETFGVKALGQLLEKQLGLTSFFIEHDTGL